LVLFSQIEFEIVFETITFSSFGMVYVTKISRGLIWVNDNLVWLLRNWSKEKKEKKGK
jgi:hypothetical protein